MLEIIQWFDNRDRLVGLIVVIGAIGWSVGHIVAQFRDPD